MPLLSTTSARLQDDLRGLIEGDAACDEVTLQLYSTDAGMLEVKPLGVVWPRTVSDVVATVKYAAEQHLTIHARGSGSGSSGGSLGSGLVLDFTRYMHRMIHSDGELACVLPGAVRERLNVLLRTTRRHFFAPSAGHFPTSTIGGILSTDCVGPRWLRYGFPHDHISELEIVTPDGQVQVLRPERIPYGPDGQILPGLDSPDSSADSSIAPESLFASSHSVWRKVVELLRRYDSVIQEEQDTTSPDSCGYRLQGVIDQGILHPERLILGSEGTLGLITQATVRTSPLSNFSGAIIFLFDGLEKAAHSIPTILEFKPTLCDMIDRRIINMVGEWDRRFLPILPSDTEVAMVVEFDCESGSDLNDRMNRLARQLRHIERLSFGSWFAFHQEEKDLFRDLLRKSKGALLGIQKPFQVSTLMEDIRVPVPALPEFFRSSQNILREHKVTCSVSGHLGYGQIRILPIVDAGSDDWKPLLDHVAMELYAEAVRHGGTIGSATGCGLVRTGAIPLRYPKLTAVFEEVKKLFDPHSIFNPGKIVPAPATGASGQLEKTGAPWQGLIRNLAPLRPAENAEPHSLPVLKTQLEQQLRWDPNQIADTTYQCAGCGLCRIRTPETRMCPSFRHTPLEIASCRAKANLLRGILDGHLPLETFTEDISRQIADWCNFCHCCRKECPALADIPKLVFRLKSAYNASHGTSLKDDFLTNIDTVLYVASLFHKTINYALGRPFPRWLLEKCVDIPQGRKLPRLERSAFLSRRPWYRRPITSPRPDEMAVALFLDTYSNYFDPRLAEAAVRVLEHNGIRVLVPPRQLSSGQSAFALGNADRAERIVRHNVSILSELVRRRYRIVTIEPVSAVCIRNEYPWVRQDNETAALAENTTDISQFLYELFLDHRLQLDFAPIHATVGYHAPCRTLALTGDSVAQATPAQELLHLIPGLNVVRLERGCCGLGGLGGMTRQNYRRSLKLGMPLTLALRDSAIQFGVCECNTCKMQMEQRTDKVTLHPLKLLAFSYGLMPDALPFSPDDEGVHSFEETDTQ